MGYGRFCQSVQLFRSFFLAVRAPRHCNGALVASQQARRCNSTSMPPQTNGALTARQLPRRRQKMTPPRSENDVFLVFLEHFQLLKLTIISLHHSSPAVFPLRTVPMRTAFTNYPLYISFVVYASPKRRVATRRDRLRANSFIPVGWVYKWAFVRLCGWHGGGRDGSRPYVWVVLQRQRLGGDANSSLKKSNIGKKNVNLHKISIIHP